ncbi:hypothetical protein K435DRAFT_570551, partial [Dendrothele bispora CBS 962.96]
AAELFQLFTTTYVTKVNAQIVAPARAVVVKPDELKSLLACPLRAAIAQPHRHPSYLAAILSYSIIRNQPFLAGNQRTGLFIANEYLRAQGLPGLIEFDSIGVYGEAANAVMERVLGI